MLLRSLFRQCKPSLADRAFTTSTTISATLTVSKKKRLASKSPSWGSRLYQLKGQKVLGALKKHSKPSFHCNSAATTGSPLDRADRTGEASSSTPSSELSGGGFAQFGLDERILSGVARLTLATPTDVQKMAIPLVMEGRNTAIQWHTGSGKTLAYLLPVMSLAVHRGEEEYQRLLAEKRESQAGSLQAVIVAPSRELAMQIVRVGQSLLPPEARGCVQQAIGGANPNRQVDAIKQNRPLVIVGTPGRLAELSRSGVLHSHTCRLLVLDEVDQLLAPQYREELVRLDQHIGRKAEGARQTIIVSATLSDKVFAQCLQYAPLAARVQMQPERLSKKPASDAPLLPTWGWDTMHNGRLGPSNSVGGVGTADLIPSMPPAIDHAWVQTTRRHRVDSVRRIVHALNAQRVLVFMNFQSRLQDTQAKLSTSQMKVACLSGNMSKDQRKMTLMKFKRGDYRALIVSDLMARGLDIEDCDAVINLELPTDASHYAHRAGRTGRAGRPGSVVSLVEAQEEFVIKKLAKRLDVDIPVLEVAHGGFRRPSQKGEQDNKEEPIPLQLAVISTKSKAVSRQ